jgi:hypothetical protein
VIAEDRAVAFARRTLAAPHRERAVPSAVLGVVVWE